MPTTTAPTTTAPTATVPTATVPTTATAGGEENPVGLTAKAVERVRSAMATEGLIDHGLRLSVVKGGCSGYEYSIKFAAAPSHGDHSYAVDGLPVYIEDSSREKLSGTVLDYVDGLYGAGLKFVNPNASYACGCGASFAVDED